MNDMQEFTRADIDTRDPEAFAAQGWQTYRKTALTPARRIDGPFRCLTREGYLDCPDGWIAIDADGYVYPIAADVFDATYELAFVPETPGIPGAVVEQPYAFVSLQEIVLAREADVLDKDEARDAARELLRRAGVIPGDNAGE